MHSGYLAATQQQIGFQEHRLSGELPGLNIFRLVCFCFFFLFFISPPSCQKSTPASSVSLAAWNRKTHEANSLTDWLPARKKKQRKKTVRFGRSREISTTMEATTTVRYLSRSDARENTTALNHSREAEQPSCCFLRFQRCCVQTPQLTDHWWTSKRRFWQLKSSQESPPC